MDDQASDKQRPSMGRAVWDFLWPSLVGAAVGIIALIILRTYF
jgi:hypothetical protein